MTTAGTDIQVWSQINVDALFEDFRIESNMADQIYLELNTDQLLRALRSASSSDEVVCRLIKQGKVPMLSFDITGQVGLPGLPLRVVTQTCTGSTGISTDSETRYTDQAAAHARRRGFA